MDSLHFTLALSAALGWLLVGFFSWRLLKVHREMIHINTLAQHALAELRKVEQNCLRGVAEIERAQLGKNELQ